MEIKDYLQIIRKHLWLFVGVVLISIILSYVLTIIQPKTFTAQSTVMATKTSNAGPKECYDENSKLCTTALLSNNYAQIVAKWYTTASITAKIYQAAGINIPNARQDKLAKTFKAVYTPEGVVSVTITGKNSNDLVNLLNSSYSVLQNKTSEFSDSKQNQYELTQTVPYVSENSPRTLLNIIIGIICGFILGTLAVMGKEYFRNNRS